MLIFAMGLHSLFEGFQLGLLPEPKEARAMFIIIILHKWNEAYQMGFSLKKGGVKFGQGIIYIGFYGLLTPIGILLGVQAERIVNDNNRLFGIL